MYCYLFNLSSYKVNLCLHSFSSETLFTLLLGACNHERYCVDCFSLLSYCFCRNIELIWIMHRCKVVIQSAKSDESEDGKPKSRPRKSITGTLCSIWEREGILGFFKGLQAQMLKTVLSSALLLMIKEKVTKTTWVLMIALRRFMLTRPNLKSS